MSLVSKSYNHDFETHPGNAPPAKSRPNQALVIIRSQLNVDDHQKPCCENCIINCVSVLDNLNDGPDDEEQILPTNALLEKRYYAQSQSTMISTASHQGVVSSSYQQLKGFVQRENHDPRSSYNRGMGKSSLDSEWKFEAKDNRVDRCAEFDKLLEGL
jgi:hypothetical protein